MADPVVLEDMAIWYGGYDVGGSLQENRFTLARAEKGNSVFGDLLEAQFPGLLVPEVSHKGFYAAGSGEPDATIGTRVITPDRSVWPVTMAPPYAPAATPGADGNIAYTIAGAQFSYEIGESHGELLPYTVKTLPRSRSSTGSPGAISRGTVLLAKATRAATTTGTGRTLGAVSATQRITGVLHVFAVNGGSWVVTIESDDDPGFPTPVVRQTFTAATAITREVIVTDGPQTDTEWRAVLTKTGGTSCVAAVILGIE